MRIFFLTAEWSAFERFFRGEVRSVEGMPSVYQPWLRFKQRGYDVHVFVVGDFDERRDMDFRGCAIHLVPWMGEVRRNGRNFWLRSEALAMSVPLYRAAVRLGDRLRPDIIYTQRESPIYAAWALSRKYGTTCIKRVYGTWLYRDWFLAPDWRTKLSCIKPILHWLWPCDLMIITHDGTFGDKVANFLHIPKRKYRMWLNGVDKEALVRKQDFSDLRSRLGLSCEDVMLVYLGRLGSWKRQDRAIRAMPLILRKIPNARLVIVGNGPQRERLEALARELGVRDNVVFVGMVPHSEIPKYLQASDIQLQFYDGSNLSNTLLEGLACGNAIITSDAGATRDVIIDGVTGLLLPNAEPSTVAEAVVSLAGDPRRRARLGRQAREFAMNNLQSWEERMDMEINLVEAIHRRRSSRQTALLART